MIPGIIAKTTKIPNWHMFQISFPHPTHVNLADSLVKSQKEKIEHLSKIYFFLIFGHFLDFE